MMSMLIEALFLGILTAILAALALSILPHGFHVVFANAATRDGQYALTFFSGEQVVRHPEQLLLAHSCC